MKKSRERPLLVSGGKERGKKGSHNPGQRTSPQNASTNRRKVCVMTTENEEKKREPPTAKVLNNRKLMGLVEKFGPGGTNVKCKWKRIVKKRIQGS